MPGKTYLITGANRGIGRGMFDHYVAQPNNTLIAAVRDPAGAQSLLNVSKGENTKVLIVKIDSASKTDPYEAVKGIDRIDVVISAAGIAPLNTVADVPLEEFENALQVNAISVMILYKATLPLLKKSDSARFAFISAAGGSINNMPEFPYPNISYTGSKALANVMVRKMDMGNMGARAFGLEKAPLTLEDSSKNTAHIVDNATKKEHSEQFFNETIDRRYPW
ncbi:putative secondary metabolism biosynthetic enzyme [Alternaria rosae]|nr:putative secondary metabolism biosynthetic enzyme [Alternaria rosae]